MQPNRFLLINEKMKREISQIYFEKRQKEGEKRQKEGEKRQKEGEKRHLYIICRFNTEKQEKEGQKGQKEGQKRHCIDFVAFVRMMKI